MNELTKEAELIIKENRRKIGPIRKETMTDVEILPYLSAYVDSVEQLKEKAAMLVKKSRGQRKETAEEFVALLEDISSYITDITNEFSEEKNRTSLADNLEEVLEMLEDLTYLDEA